MPKKILIIDDTEIDRMLLKRILAVKGFEVITLGDPETCLELIEKEQVDMVLLDALLPDTHGNQILQDIRNRYTEITLPVIMVTGQTEAQDIVESLRLGANDYITKPITIDVAISRIRTHLKIAELSKEMSRLKELEAVNAMIITYNHEINNPLAIALTTLCVLEKDGESKNLARMRKSLTRISEIVKQIMTLHQEGKLEFEQYSARSKMIKLR